MERVAAYIQKEGLLSREGLHIIALSGGADSVALLLILHSLGYRIEAAHCNFHLRGEESNRDETFVKSLCKEHNIPLHLIHFDTAEYASLHQVSIEMAARELRYRYLSSYVMIWERLHQLELIQPSGYNSFVSAFTPGHAYSSTTSNSLFSHSPIASRVFSALATSHCLENVFASEASNVLSK